MKKIITVLLVAGMLLALTACGEGKSACEGEHAMGGWKYYTVGDLYTVGEKRNTCTNCGYTETKIEYDDFFREYMTTAHRLGAFSSVDELTLEEEDGRIIQAIIDNVEAEGLGSSDRGNPSYGFKIDDVNEYTSNRLGRTYDYTNMGVVPTEAGICTYDAQRGMLVEERYEGDGFEMEYVGYTTEDNIHFTVTYHIDYQKYVSNIELIDGKYIITSQTVSNMEH